jgi:hypothetical protein
LYDIKKQKRSKRCEMAKYGRLREEGREEGCNKWRERPKIFNKVRCKQRRRGRMRGEDAHQPNCRVAHKARAICKLLHGFFFLPFVSLVGRRGNALGPVFFGGNKKNHKKGN